MEEALDGFEAAFEARSGWLVFVQADPAYEPLLNEPRFAAIVRKMGLPPRGG
jgi:hypothetical protein